MITGTNYDGEGDTEEIFVIPETATVPVNTTLIWRHSKESESTIVPMSIMKQNNDKSNDISETEVREKSRWMRNWFWWNPSEGNVPMEFCRESSIHGLKYIGERDRHLSERIFWTVVFICGACLSAYLINEVLIKYETSPIIVSYDSSKTTIDEVIFPANTICSMNKVLKSKAVEYLGPNGDPEDAYYTRHVCGITKSFTKRLGSTNENEGKYMATQKVPEQETSPENTKKWTSVNKFLRKATQTCSDMIPYCSWKGVLLNDCSEIFRPVETEFGKCCAFNRMPPSLLFTLRDDDRDNEEEIRQWEKWDFVNKGFLIDKDYPFEYPRRQMQSGKDYGLTFMLNPREDEYFCTSSDSNAFQMSTHLPIDSSRVMGLGTRIVPGAEVDIAVKPEITLVDPSVYNYPIEIRDCYVHGEYSLKYFKYYTIANCLDECIANETLTICGCKRYFMPRGANEPLCGGDSFGNECAEEVKHKMSYGGSRNSCKMCLDTCNEMHYTTSVAIAPLQRGIRMKAFGNDTLLHQKVGIVNVFIPEDSIYPRIRKEYFGKSDLMASFGGVMGLSMGFSGFSVVELFYFFTLRLWWNRKRLIGNRANLKKQDTKINTSNEMVEMDSTSCSRTEIEICG